MICLWPLPQRSLREGMTFAIRGAVLLAVLNSIVCFIALPRHLHLFYGSFWSPAVPRLAGAVAFFPCQMANNSGLEPNSELVF